MSALPEAFADLERFESWIKPTEMTRNRNRLSRSYAEIEDFYNTALPRVSDIIEYLNTLDHTDLPAPEQNLMNLLHALSDAAPCVEWWQDVTYAAGFDPQRITILQ